MSELGYITFGDGEHWYEIVGVRKAEREIDYLDDFGNEQTCKFSQCSLVGRPRI